MAGTTYVKGGPKSIKEDFEKKLKHVFSLTLSVLKIILLNVI